MAVSDADDSRPALGGWTRKATCRDRQQRGRTSFDQAAVMRLFGVADPPAPGSTASAARARLYSVSTPSRPRLLLGSSAVRDSSSRARTTSYWRRGGPLRHSSGYSTFRREKHVPRRATEMVRLRVTRKVVFPGHGLSSQRRSSGSPGGFRWAVRLLRPGVSVTSGDYSGPGIGCGGRGLPVRAVTASAAGLSRFRHGAGAGRVAAVRAAGAG